MRNLTLIFAALSGTLLVACATAPTPKTSSEIVKSSKAMELERKLKEREEALQDIKDQNRVLKKKAELQNKGSEIAARALPQSKKIELAAVPSTAKNDRELYQELMVAYERNNEVIFSSRLGSFLEKYPKSPLADEALYLAGLLALSNKNYGPALRYLNQLLKNYPTGNKVPAALFAKGVTFKKMNLPAEARVSFLKVRKSYPGSPEALRAQTELKLLVR